MVATFFITLLIGIAIWLYHIFYVRSMRYLSLGEKLVSLGVVTLIIIITSAGVYFINDRFIYGDEEILNGYVTKKDSTITSCEHQYKCGETCSTNLDGSKSCTPIYCDEHAFDMNWNVYSNIGSTRISRVDRQGIIEPPRYSKVIIGEPFSLSNSVTNFFIGSEENYRTSDEIREKYKDLYVPYPKLFDYYQVNTVVNLSKSFQLSKQFNDYLRDRLKKMGSEKQVNIVVVVTDDTDPHFFNALMDKWKGGKKNDVILVYGLDSESNIKWFESNTFANGQSNRHLIENLKVNTYSKKLDLNHLVSQTDIIYNTFNRLSNAELEYMRDSTGGVNIFVQLGYILIISIVNFLIIRKLAE